MAKFASENVHQAYFPMFRPRPFHPDCHTELDLHFRTPDLGDDSSGESLSRLETSRGDCGAVPWIWSLRVFQQTRSPKTW